MNRMTAALCALVLFATACGGSESSSGESVLTELDPSGATLRCITAEIGDAGLDASALLDSTREELDVEQAQALLDATRACEDADGTVGDDDGDGTIALGDADTDADEADPGGDDTATADDDTAAVGDDADDTDSGADTTTTEAPDDTSPGRSYEDLTLLERSFIDGFVQTGGDEAYGICVLDAVLAAGLSIGELAALDDDAELPPELFDAIIVCGGEADGTGLLDGDDFFTDDEWGGTYGDNPDLDLLWDACAAGDGERCDELYWTTSIGSGYEAFGQSCGERFDDETGGGCATRMSPELPDGYGSDATLDAFWDDCEAGILTACDSLYWQSPIGSAYEDFGSTCGGRSEATFGECETDPQTYGEDVYFDGLWDDCEGGDYAACDELYLFSPIGSDYEAFGNSCGGRTSDLLQGDCESTFG